MAGVPGFSPRAWAILPTTLLPGRCPPVPVFAPCPPLKWKAWQQHPAVYAAYRYHNWESMDYDPGRPHFWAMSRVGVPAGNGD